MSFLVMEDISPEKPRGVDVWVLDEIQHDVREDSRAETAWNPEEWSPGCCRGSFIFDYERLLASVEFIRLGCHFVIVGAVGVCRLVLSE
jgi:hypothetical protein